jgi:hypothetical protein
VVELDYLASTSLQIATAHLNKTSALPAKRHMYGQEEA